MASETHGAPSWFRPAQIDHACGHRFTHLLSVPGDGEGELLGAIELLSMHPCPSCVAGVPDWAVGPYLDHSAGSEAGAC